jgi:hypothetical protein
LRAKSQHEARSTATKRLEFSSNSEDTPLEKVSAFLSAQLDFEERAGEVIRRSFDEAIMGPHRGRFAISELDPTEKAYIGLRVQLLLQGEFELSKGTKLDCEIAGHDVDIKFALTRTWTIPPEAENELCLLIKADEVSARFSVGLMRITSSRLTAKANRDGKHGVSAAGKKEILWLLQDAPMPRNFFLEMDPSLLKQILQQRPGQARINELFRTVQNQIIPRIAIFSLALQDDPMKRARDARKHLLRDHILVLCGRYQWKQAHELGFDLSSREWLSVKVDDKTYVRLSRAKRD